MTNIPTCTNDQADQAYQIIAAVLKQAPDYNNRYAKRRSLKWRLIRAATANKICRALNAANIPYKLQLTPSYGQRTSCYDILIYALLSYSSLKAYRAFMESTKQAKLDKQAKEKEAASSAITIRISLAQRDKLILALNALPQEPDSETWETTAPHELADMLSDAQPGDYRVHDFLA